MADGCRYIGVVISHYDGSAVGDRNESVRVLDAVTFTVLAVVDCISALFDGREYLVGNRTCFSFSSSEAGSPSVAEDFLCKFLRGQLLLQPCNQNGYILWIYTPCISNHHYTYS